MGLQPSDGGDPELRHSHRLPTHKLNAESFFIHLGFQQFWGFWTVIHHKDTQQTPYTLPPQQAQPDVGGSRSSFV